MNKASGSIHLDSLSKASDYSDFPKRIGTTADGWPIYGKSPLWGKRKLSDAEYARQAEAMRKFCR